MAALPEPYINPEEYLERERGAEEKSEYFNGEVVAMAGASPDHIAIVWNISGQLYSRLAGTPCRGGSADQRVKNPETGAYVYPDVVVVCGEPRYEGPDPGSLLNPTVVFEVLSPSTESYDLGVKFAHYRYLESLREMVAVAQDRVYAQHWMRRNDGRWLVEDITDIGETLRLESIGCELRLVDVYERVELASKAETE